MNRKFAAALGLAAALLAAPAIAPVQAKDRSKGSEPPPAVFREVIECRVIADPAARLACYDAKVATLAEAQTKEELFVASKEDIQKTRRGLFGFSLPKIALFGEDDADEAAIKEIDSKITAIGRGQSGYVFTLDDGATWVQTDGMYIDKPREGMAIRIKRAALGSYMAKVNGGVAIRVKRDNR